MAKSKMKQTAVVLDWLQRNGELTNREAVVELNILSLPKRIEELRKSGHKIVTTYRKSTTGAKYGVYTLQE